MAEYSGADAPARDSPTRRGRTRREHRPVRPRWQAWVLLALCLVLTLGTSYAANRTLDNDLRDREAQASRQLRDATEAAFNRIVAGQRRIADTVAAGPSDATKVQLFDAKVAASNLVNDETGVIAYALVLPDAAGIPEVKSIGPEYLSSSISSKAAAEVVEAVAKPLVASTRSGEARASVPIQLNVLPNAPSEDQPIAFLTLYPMYEGGQHFTNPADREQKVSGWIAAATIGNNFLRAILGRKTGFASVEMFDGTTTRSKSLLARQPTSPDPTQTRVGPEQMARIAALGRSYTLRFSAFFTAADPSLELAKRILLLLGLGISGLVFVLAWMQRRSEIRAYRMVDDATASVAASEERFRALVRDSNDLVLVLDGRGRLEYASPAGYRMFGYDNDDLLGSDVFSLVHPDDQEDAREAFATLIQTTRLDDPVEFRARRADHSWANLEVKGTNQLDNPAVAGLVVHARDVSERKRTEAELRGVEERFRAVVQNSTDLLVVLDTESRITYASDASRTVLGYEPEELTMNLFDLIHPDDRDRVASAELDVLTGVGTDNPIEVRARHRDGHWVHLEIVANNLVENPAIRGILVSARDITERRRAEAELHAAQERFHSAFAHTPLGMLLAQPDGSIFRVNEALCDLLGRRDDELVGAPLASVFAPAERFRIQTELGTMLASRSSVHQLEFQLDAVSKDQEVWGAVNVSLVQDDTGAPLHYIAQIEDISERKVIRERLWHQSHHDQLTGLPNRVLFMERLRHGLDDARRRGRPVAVIFLDLDRFKRVNDSAGHAAGDALLRSVAERLQSTLRPDDTVARFGGDEFALLCRDLIGPEAATEIAQRITDALGRPFMLDEEVFVTASIGIAVSSGDDTPERLLHAADRAMYQAKERGRACTVVFEADESSESGPGESVYADSALHRALDRDELQVHYQPFVNLLTGKITGFEALLRWNHPERGLLLPGEFLGVAEDTGLIAPIGLWVLEHACRQAADWQARSPEHAGLMMSVNLSPRQVLEPGLDEGIQRILRETGIDPDTVWFEIAESTLVRDSASTLGTLRSLRAAGPHLSIDDFGTGYSSMRFLQSSPIEALKIDRRFVAGLGQDHSASAIVTAVVSLAHALDLAPVAEGVETFEQVVELRALGCEYAQGYLFGHPTDAVATESLLDRHPDLVIEVEGLIR